METAVAYAALIVAVVAILGFIGTWIRNGRHQATKFQKVTDAVSEVRNDLADPNTGLGALNEKMTSISRNCASTTASFTERFVGHGRETKEIKDRLVRLEER